MSDYKSLIEKIEYFYIEIVEEFKEAEQGLINDSQFRSFFRQKDYDSNIEFLKTCKRKAQKIHIKDIKIEKSDKLTEKVANTFLHAVSAFVSFCDAYIQLQVFLKKKAMKEDAPFSVYKEISNKVKKGKETAHFALHDLDLVYTDYTELHQ